MAAPDSLHAFDQAYYSRFYKNPKTRVISPREAERLSAFVCSYVKYLGVPVRTVLDLGCGLGLWRQGIRRQFPRARYQGVEYSRYLCEQMGWEHGSVVDYRAKAPYDLVICQGVLPYLSSRDAKAAMANLARLCRGALYLEAVTQEDWDEGVVDTSRTDGAMQLRPRRFYMRGLAQGFLFMGGGLWLSIRANRPVYALERG